MRRVFLICLYFSTSTKAKKKMSSPMKHKKNMTFSQPFKPFLYLYKKKSITIIIVNIYLYQKLEEKKKCAEE